MNDTYVPMPADTAECPYCSRLTPGVCVASEHIVWAGLQMVCPFCGGHWDEARCVTAVGRHWEVPARPQLTGAGCHARPSPPDTGGTLDAAP